MFIIVVRLYALLKLWTASIISNVRCNLHVWVFFFCYAHVLALATFCYEVSGPINWCNSVSKFAVLCKLNFFFRFLLHNSLCEFIHIGMNKHANNYIDLSRTASCLLVNVSLMTHFRSMVSLDYWFITVFTSAIVFLEF